MFKHGVLLALLSALKRGGEPLRIVETHAGAGLYDLGGDLAKKSREAEAGIMRLMADAEAPAAFDALKDAVRSVNAAPQVRLYPGSPVQLTQALGAGDAYIGCELRPDDHAALDRVLRDRPCAALVRAELADGYAFAANLPVWGGRTLIVIDPPFERGDEYEQVVRTTASAVRRGETVAIWAPLKDLETLDAFISRLESLQAQPMLVAEVRLRPLSNPTMMNGCAMILIGTPDVNAAVVSMADWVTARCGDAGGTTRVAPT